MHVLAADPQTSRFAIKRRKSEALLARSQVRQVELPWLSLEPRPERQSASLLGPLLHSWAALEEPFSVGSLAVRRVVRLAQRSANLSIQR